jgi:hypothetical protein
VQDLEIPDIPDGVMARPAAEAERRCITLEDLVREILVGLKDAQAA